MYPFIAAIILWIAQPGLAHAQTADSPDQQVTIPDEDVQQYAEQIEKISPEGASKLRQTGAGFNPTS